LACWQRLHLAQASGPATKSAERRAYRQQPRKRSASELRINATEAYIATETYMKSDDSAEITSWWRETLERVALVLATLIVLVVPAGLLMGWMPTLIHIAFTVMGLLGVFAIAKCLDLREQLEGHRPNSVWRRTGTGGVRPSSIAVT